MTRPELLRRGGERRRGRGLWILPVLLVLILLIVGELYFAARFIPVYVDGASMEPTLHGESDASLKDGDWLYADKYAVPKRGDIVICDVSDERDEYGHLKFNGIGIIIKRIIAVEGDTVRFEDGQIALRYAGTEAFVRLTEPYANGECGYFPEVTLKEGEVFLLGDNRRVSHDSSEVGPLHASNIMGVVPQWAVSCKNVITSWENFRGTFTGAK